MADEVMTGTVISVVLTKGFCFIRGQDGLSRFAHVRDFQFQIDFELLSEGKAVEFIPMDLNNTGEQIRGNGLRAVRVRTINA